MLCHFLYIQKHFAVCWYIVLFSACTEAPLFVPFLSSAGPSSPPGQTNVASIDWLGGDQVSKVGSSHVAPDACQPSLSTNAVETAADSCQPSCRPWERGDLLRRLATFKTSTWDSKPKVIYSLIQLMVVFIINHSLIVDYNWGVCIPCIISVDVFSINVLCRINRLWEVENC
jgi:hypothetical protein